MSLADHKNLQRIVGDKAGKDVHVAQYSLVQLFSLYNPLLVFLLLKEASCHQHRQCGPLKSKCFLQSTVSSYYASTLHFSAQYQAPFFHQLQLIADVFLLFSILDPCYSLLPKLRNFSLCKINLESHTTIA